MGKKVISEGLGTFVLVLFGTGSVVFGRGIGTLGIALAFGLSIVAMAYSIGTVSGCHINPAVSIAMYLNKRLSFTELMGYIGGQLVGAVAATGVVKFLLTLSDESVFNLGQNTVGEVGVLGGFLVEGLLTFFFVLVILAVTGKQGHPELAGLVIGLTLVLVHLFGIPLTGASVNPARSLAPALFVGGEALSQVWIYIVAPIVGGVFAAIVSNVVLDSEK